MVIKTDTEGKPVIPTKEDIIAFGIERQARDYYKQKSLKAMVLNDLLFFESYISKVDHTAFEFIFNTVEKQAPDRLNKKIWIDKFKEIVSKATLTELQEFTGSGWYNILKSNRAHLYMKIFKRLVDLGEISGKWEDIFYSIYNTMKSNSSNMYDGGIFDSIAEGYFREKPEAAKSLMHNIEFKALGAKVRGALYRGYIEAGLLDKKVARRIRSDSSQYASRSGAKALIKHRKKYSNFKELILMFVDVKHDIVQQEIANSAPDDIVPFLMGFDNIYAKKVLEKRATAITKKKEESKNG